MRKHVVAGALAAAVAGSGALALFTGVAQAAPVASHQARAATAYTFTTLDDQADPTFNQLLGINVHNVIAGYFGSGAAGAPEQGLPAQPALRAGQLRQRELPRLRPDPGHRDRRQGQHQRVLGHRATAPTTGSSNGTGCSPPTTTPTPRKTKGSVNQLLGINNAGTAVGFYNDAKGNSHAYELTRPPGCSPRSTSPACRVAATGINNAGDIVGFATDAARQHQQLAEGRHHDDHLPVPRRLRHPGVRDQRQEPDRRLLPRRRRGDCTGSC